MTPTWLTSVRHHCSRESPVKRWNIRSFQPTLWHSSVIDIHSSLTWPPPLLLPFFPLAAPANTLVSLHLQLMKATVLAESTLYFIFSLGSLHSSDIYRWKSGTCRTLPFFLTFYLSRFSFYIKTYRWNILTWIEWLCLSGNMCMPSALRKMPRVQIHDCNLDRHVAST